MVLEYLLVCVHVRRSISLVKKGGEHLLVLILLLLLLESRLVVALVHQLLVMGR